MSKPGPPSSHNNRITPSFFGSPSLYQPSGNSSNNDLAGSQPTKAKNPDWNDAVANPPPPPYSPAPNSPQSISTDPSAPPLEQDESIYPPVQPPLQQQAYPPQGYYGAVPYTPPRQPNNVSDVREMTNWPWAAPLPSSVAQSLYMYHPSQQIPVAPPAPGEYENYSAPPSQKKKKSCCELSLQYFFYFFCICLVIRLIDLLSGGSINLISGSCSYGTVWQDLPKEFQFGAGLQVQVVGGKLTGGHIIIRSLEDSNKGKINPIVMYSPASMTTIDDFSYSERHIMDSTLLDIIVPQNLPKRACVSLNAIIYVPKNSSFLVIDVQNSRIDVTDERLSVNVLKLQTTNQAIEFHTRWEGLELALTTTNNMIDVEHTIKNSKTVTLTTTNGSIRTRCPIKATEGITMTTTNNAIDADGTLESNQVVNLATTNGHVNAYNISAMAFQAKTTNGRITINHSYVSLAANVQTTNDRVNFALTEGRSTEVIATTTNAEIETQMPIDFEGTFEINTSSHNKLKLTDHRNWTHISYITNNMICGDRFTPEHRPNPPSPMGKVTVSTTNAIADLKFGSHSDVINYSAKI